MHNFKIKVVLVDIEGTTTLISFVKDILFPYAMEHCRSYLEQTWNTDMTQSIVAELIALPQYKEYQIENDEIANADTQSTVPTIEQITKFVIYLINLDLKLKPLKSLQGLIWENGYKKGEIIAHVFDDVPKAFETWHNEKILIAVYSSGNIHAQKLLFERTKFGNLLKYISKHFDTTSGMKTEVNSYKNIVNDLKVKAEDVLFLTDVVAEADAAQTAGLQVALLRRAGNADLPQNFKPSYILVNNFDELNLTLLT